jgi:hypothetical protein
LFPTTLSPQFGVEQYAPLPADRGFILRLPTEGSDVLRFIVNWDQRGTSSAPVK